MSFLDAQLANNRLTALREGISTLSAANRQKIVNEHFAPLSPLDRHRYVRLIESVVAGEEVKVSFEAMSNFESAFESVLAPAPVQRVPASEAKVIELGKSFGIIPSYDTPRISDPNLRAYQAEVKVLEGLYPGYDFENQEQSMMYDGLAFQESYGLLKAVLCNSLVPEAVTESTVTRSVTPGQAIMEAKKISDAGLKKIVYQELDDVSVQLAFAILSKGRFQPYHASMRDKLYQEVVDRPTGDIAVNVVGSYAHRVGENADRLDLSGIFGQQVAESIADSDHPTNVRVDAYGNTRVVTRQDNGWKVSAPIAS